MDALGRTNRFNTEAASWDLNPTVYKASALALKSLLRNIPGLIKSELDVMEIGCGTGLLSFMVAPLVRSLVAVDAAEGMINALNLKLNDRREVTNILPVWAELESSDDQRINIDPVTRKHGRREVDLIISHLVLHHIPSLSSILSVMHGCLKTGGMVALTDFENTGPESRRYHAESRMDGVQRHGVSKVEMKDLLTTAGFIDVTVEETFRIEKWVEKTPGSGVIKSLEAGGIKQEFPFLICTGRKG